MSVAFRAMTAAEFAAWSGPAIQAFADNIARTRQIQPNLTPRLAQPLS
jgi:hypothetical protein